MEFISLSTPKSKADIKTDICRHISTFDKEIREYRERSQFWQRMIELAHHSIRTYTKDPFEETSIFEYIADLEEAKDNFNSINETIYKLKKSRNELQRQQSNIK